MSQNNIPQTVPSVERLIQRITSAEKSQQKEIRISIAECRELVTDLALITAKLGKTVQEINDSLKEIKENTKNIDIKFDGGSF
jgi:septation ring formation regulator EzrA